MKYPETITAVREVYRDALFRAFQVRPTEGLSLERPPPEEMIARVDRILPKLAEVDKIHKRFIAPMQLEKPYGWRIEDTMTTT